MFKIYEIVGVIVFLVAFAVFVGFELSRVNDKKAPSQEIIQYSQQFQYGWVITKQQIKLGKGAAPDTMAQVRYRIIDRYLTEKEIKF